MPRIFDNIETDLLPALEQTLLVSERTARRMREQAATAFKDQLTWGWDSLCNECKPTDGTAPTVEDVLTELRTLANRRGNSDFLGMTKKALSNLDMEICALIVKEMKKSLPEHRNS